MVDGPRALNVLKQIENHFGKFRSIVTVCITAYVINVYVYKRLRYFLAIQRIIVYVTVSASNVIK